MKVGPAPHADCIPKPIITAKTRLPNWRRSGRRPGKLSLDTRPHRGKARVKGNRLALAAWTHRQIPLAALLGNFANMISLGSTALSDRVTFAPYGSTTGGHLCSHRRVVAIPENRTWMDKTITSTDMFLLHTDRTLKTMLHRGTRVKSSLYVIGRRVKYGKPEHPVRAKRTTGPICPANETKELLATAALASGCYGSAQSHLHRVALGKRGGHLEIFDEVMMNELGGEDAGQSHVFGLAGGQPLADFLHQLIDRLRLEQVRAPERLWRQHFAQVVAT